MNALTDRQAWLFSIKTYLAAVAALYIAMAGNLSRPYWAMGTVYIVSQPLLGPTRAKGVYRIVGTLVAGLATLLVLPALVETPLVLSAAMSIWLAGCMFMALLNRGPVTVTRGSAPRHPPGLGPAARSPRRRRRRTRTSSSG